jgi:23S rRNA G2069 N7-methylase RlmK/C1962 C5-methylase RlmI
MTEKDRRQADFFRNRLVKNERSLRRWARREGIEAFRIYDRDIPEVPLAVDLFRREGGTALLLALYERPYEKDEAFEAEWLDLMAEAASGALGTPRDLVFTRTRKRQRGEGQYERAASKRFEWTVKEGGLTFIVNLSDYLDTGLFLDHRPTRALVRADAGGCQVLNLFAYTGSFSVYAASGGAKSVTSVDLSNTYLAWAGRNLAANGFEGPAFPLVREDASAFLHRSAMAGRRWDLIVADPPTFSNSKSSGRDFDLNLEWPRLVGSCLSVLAPGGTLYFSTNSRRLKWDPSLVAAPAEDISEATIPPDFRNRRAHRCWLIRGAPVPM